MSEDEEDDDDLFEDDEEERPDVALIENDGKNREVVDKICELEELQETLRKDKAD